MKKELDLGLDVHKDCIVHGGSGGRAAEGRCATGRDQQRSARGRKMDRAVASGAWQGGAILRACYEAGPCGFRAGAAVRTTRSGVRGGGPFDDADASGDRVKTDKRDARKLARLLRAGELHLGLHSRMHAMKRSGICAGARSDAVDDRRRSRHRLKGFLLAARLSLPRQERWSAAHERYLRELVLPHPAMKVILEEYLQAIAAAGNGSNGARRGCAIC